MHLASHYGRPISRRPLRPILPRSGLDTYVCRQFPAEDNPVHRIIAGLLMVAVALPTKRVIERLFELSNDPAGYEGASKRAWLVASTAGLHGCRLRRLRSLTL